jgi:uncharacterized protein (DUF983 family)
MTVSKVSEQKQGAIGVCPRCGGETRELPYSRWSRCRVCGKETPTKDCAEVRS